jgi:hypothetical protein
MLSLDLACYCLYRRALHYCMYENKEYVNGCPQDICNDANIGPLSKEECFALNCNKQEDARNLQKGK